MPDTPQTYSAPMPASSSAERIWSEVSQLHSQYLATTAASHTAFLNAAASLLGGQPLTPSAPAPVQRLAAPVTAPQPQPAPQAAAPAPAPIAAPAPAPAPYTNGAAVAQPAPPAAPARVAAAPTPPAPVARQAPATSASEDPVALVQAIVSDKTGYPVDMLDPNMDLEGELGVDSIKQVEILSTLRERLPHLPEIDPEQLVELRTINAIAAMIGGSAPAPAAPVPVAAAPAPVAAPTAVSAPAPAPAANGNGNGITPDVIRALVADKTGYPSSMLEDDMDLEGELGVDSIKQVEILSALRDQHPSLPEVDPEAIAELRTIRKIADFFS
jgi:acyl carrier protein